MRSGCSGLIRTPGGELLAATWTDWAAPGAGGLGVENCLAAAQHLEWAGVGGSKLRGRVERFCARV